MKHIWLKVTKDRYELPLIATDTVKEMAEKVGVHEDTIYKCLSRDRKNESIPSEYVKVEVESYD